MPKRIFISFAVPEDNRYRDFLVGQSKNKNSPFEFYDMSVKNPYLNSWKTQCRSKIKGCDGLIALVSKDTKNSDGALWEIKCANDEGIPVLGVLVTRENKGNLPIELKDNEIIFWIWDEIAQFINSL